MNTPLTPHPGDSPVEIPLTERLRSVPKYGRDIVESAALGHRNIPYGALCHGAADRIDIFEARIRELETDAPKVSTPNDGGPAFPHQDWDPVIQSPRRDHGMSLRAYLASRETLSDYDNPDAVFTKEQAVALIGRPIPAFKDALGVLQWEAEWRAALKIMRADALIKALEEKR